MKYILRLGALVVQNKAFYLTENSYFKVHLLAFSKPSTTSNFFISRWSFC